ncbi:hypothetical protein [Flexivirga oryzae]|uniref:Uncharacterized protein n=1 Tax=Flexivirga oryzae TaxID=1794944 RepID=A0A839NDM1_9MICO|nr:hypothetical protein [Flexivirga oryzae]MBB2892632.1 hypothetical protein [Flexivirga oryzae]
MRAPLGGRFVEVEWDSGSNASAQTVGAVDIGGNHPVTLTLVAGGHRYRLDTFRTDALVDGSAVIAVDGDGDDLRIEATYAGVTQSVDPTTGTRRAGRADLLYNSGGWSPVVGDGAPSAKPRAKLQWQTSDNGGSAIRLAYVDGSAGHRKAATGWSSTAATSGCPTMCAGGRRGTRRRTSTISSRSRRSPAASGSTADRR